MKKSNLKKLICPKCKSKLGCKTSKLTCKKCNSKFEIINSIPRFIENLDEVRKDTSKNFGFKWDKFQKINQYYIKNFLDEIRDLPKDFFKGKRILDVGCGIGIPSYCMSKKGGKEIYAFDISNSVEQAYENTKRLGVNIMQADIYKLPFKKEFFDTVVCVAVLHHLPKQKKAFKMLLDLVKPKGHIILWVYGKEGNSFVRFFVEPVRKLFTRKMPMKIVYSMSYFLGLLFKFITTYIYKPLNKIGIKFLPMNEYLIYRSNFSFSNNFEMIFDQLLAPVSKLYSRKEFESLFKDKNLKLCKIRHHNKNSWFGYAQKI